MTHISTNDIQITVDAQDNWRVFLPENQFNLVLTKQQRQNILDWAMQLFTEWVIEGQTFDITYDFDPPWDYSGETVRRDLEENELMEIMDGTLGQWMDKFTGNWRPTFVSGYGKSHDRYSDEIQEHISTEVHELLKVQVAPELWDEIWDSDEWCDVVLALEEALLEQIAAISAAEAYRRFEAKTRREIAQRELEAQARRRVEIKWQKQTRRFWNKHFMFLSSDIFIDKPTWRKLGLATRLQKALTDAEPADIEAILEVGLPGNFSNSVSAEIKRIVTESSGKDRKTDMAEDNNINNRQRIESPISAVPSE